MSDETSEELAAAAQAAMVVASMSPQVVVQALIDAGWQAVGGREGTYSALRDPREPNGSMVVPLDRSMGDYGDLMGRVLLRLVRDAERGTRAVQALRSIARKDEQQ